MYLCTKATFYPLARYAKGLFKWLRRLESNQLPSAYEADELPMLHGAKFSVIKWYAFFLQLFGARRTIVPENARLNMRWNAWVVAVRRPWS